MKTDIEQCNADAAECLLAWIVCGSSGGEFTGAHLQRYRLLPERERRYFAAVCAPQCEPSGVAIRRTQTVENGVLKFDPPLPVACDCDAPVLHDYMRESVRCVRCLRFWGERFHTYAAGPCDPPKRRQSVGGPLADTIERKHIGFALEHVEALRGVP